MIAAATSSEIASKVGKTSVSGVAKKRPAKTSNGVSSSATCSAELMTTEMAKSGRLRAASCTPTTFSTALPAIATTTRPANAWLMPSASVAGLSAETNQSLTNAAARPAPPSTTTVVVSDQRGGEPACSSPPARNPGSVRKKSTSRTPAQIRLSVFSCAAAGA